VSDLLTATSLLTTLLALLYTVWYPEIKDCLEILPERKRADRGSQIQQVDATLYTRGVPLAGGAVVLCLVLLPEAGRLIGTAITNLTSEQPSAWPPYDTLAATFVVAYGFLLGMTFMAGVQVQRLWRQRRRLNESDTT
jgi:hypothetical protein